MQFSNHTARYSSQRGSDTPHTLDLVITSDDCISNLEHLSPLGMSDHCVLKFICKLHIEESTSVVSKFNLDKGEYDQLREFFKC